MDQTDHQYPGAAARRVRDVIERLLREGAAVARSDGTTHDLFPIAVSAAEGEALRGWVAREKATRTVEIGLAYAISALHVCEGLLENGDPGRSGGTPRCVLPSPWNLLLVLRREVI